MKKRAIMPIVFCATILFVFVFVIAPVNISAQRSSISGFVFGPDRRPIPDTYVELLNEVYSILARVKTDGSGRFNFQGLSPGRFQIRALSMGRDLESRPEDVEISGVGVSGRPVSDHVQRDIFMKPRKNEFAKDQVTGVVFAQDVPAAAETAFKAAIEDLNNERTESGLKSLNNALDLFPTYYLALERLGFVKIKAQDYQGAVDVMKRLVAVNEKSFTGWYGLANSYHSLKMYPESVEAANKAIEMNRGSSEAYYVLGMALRPQGKIPEAEKALLQVETLTNGKDANAHWNLALLYAHDLKRFDKAADHLERFLKASPDAPNKDTIKKLIKQFKDKAKET
jgi:tetratricopeptide (TPR) repeat protein